MSVHKVTPIWMTQQPMEIIVKSLPEPDEIGTLTEEVVDLAKQGDSDNVQELLDTHNQELATDKLIEMHHLHAEIVEVEIEVVSPSIVPSGNFAELNRTVTCMVLKTNDRHTSCPCHDEFHGSRFYYVRQIEAHEIRRGKGLEVRQSLALSTIQVTVPFSSAKFSEGTIDSWRNHLPPPPSFLHGTESSRMVKVSDRGWPCHEIEPSTTKDPPCKAPLYVKSVESSNILPLVRCGS
ncbi:hypothetical protein TNCV_118711 [Trichonephila clavipes]|nr:hypothetical protein TNCV_118711 [Trichonephila clavipes]